MNSVNTVVANGCEYVYHLTFRRDDTWEADADGCHGEGSTVKSALMQLRYRLEHRDSEKGD